MTPRRWLPSAAALLLIALDQWTKHLSITCLTAPVSLIPNVVGLHLAFNTGGAFSLPLGGAALAAALSLVLLGLGGLYLMRLTRGKWMHAAMTLIAAGGTGNVIDRLLRGAVTDMIRLEFISFPIFNLADIYVTVGAGLLVLSLFLAPHEWKERDHAQ